MNFSVRAGYERGSFIFLFFQFDSGRGKTSQFEKSFRFKLRHMI